MGPRSCERGNGTNGDGYSDAGTLQWGRARASAEMTGISFAILHAEHASMGPRSCERGNSAVVAGRPGREIASMGPRSCERGNSSACREACHLVYRFNGAALVRARKLPRILVGVSPTCLLQWGRARASAEIRALAGRRVI